MISEIYVLREGLNVFHRSYQAEATEDTVRLASGFFQAILVFSKELGEKQLQSINMQSSVFHFKIHHHFTFVIREEEQSRMSLDQIELVLNLLSDAFHIQFPNAIDATNSGIIRPGLFDNFALTCDQVIKKRPKRQGFPILLGIAFKPFFTAPEIRIVAVTADHIDTISELQFHIKRYYALLGKKAVKYIQKTFLLYLAKTRRIAYIVPIMTISKSNEPTHLLCFMTEENDFLTFYHLMPLIYRKSDRITVPLSEYLTHIDDFPLVREMEESSKMSEVIESWADLAQYQLTLRVNLIEEISHSATGNIQLSEAQIRARFQKLVNRINIDMGRVIFALLRKKQILFTAEEQQREDVEMSINALLSFYPYASVLLWANSDTVMDHQIIGIQQDKTSKYDPKTTVKIDLMNNLVYNAEKNDYCDQLMTDTLMYLQYSVFAARTYFQDKINSLFDVMKNLLKELTLEEDKQQEVFHELLKSKSKAAVELLLRLSEFLNPLLEESLDKYLQKRRKAG